MDGRSTRAASAANLLLVHAGPRLGLCRPSESRFHVGMLRLTRDTNCVIAAAQNDDRRPLIDHLVELAQAGRIQLWLISAFAYDQTIASDERYAANFGWLANRPFIGEIPGFSASAFHRSADRTSLLTARWELLMQRFDAFFYQRSWPSGKCNRAVGFMMRIICQRTGWLGTTYS
jgi:hypothetical protein